MKTLPLLLLVGTALSACGGGSSAPTVPAPVPDPDIEPIVVDIPEEEEEDAAPAEPETIDLAAARIFKGSDGDFLPSLSLAEETVTLNVNGEKLVIPVLDGGLLPAHRLAAGEKDGVEYIVGIQGTDAAEAGFLSGLNPDNPDAVTAFIFAERLEDTQMPTTGAATFNGDYLGLLANSIAIAGDATLTADFADGSIAGVISNRRSVDVITGEDNGVVTSTDLILEITEIGADGLFSGGLSGGDLDDGENIIAGSNGLYNGLVAGETGNSVAGGLRNEYETGVGKAFEVGSFIAE